MQRGKEELFLEGNIRSLPLFSSVLTVLFSAFFSVELWLVKEIERRRGFFWSW